MLSKALPNITPAVALPLERLLAVSPVGSVYFAPGILFRAFATANLAPALAPPKSKVPKPIVPKEVIAIVAKLGTCLTASLIPHMA